MVYFSFLISYLTNSHLPMASCLRKMVDGLVALAAFRARYDIPDEIGLELVEADYYGMEKTVKGFR